MNYIPLFIIIFLPAQTCLAQKVIKASGSAQVRVERDMSMDETMEKARELAKINAIEKEFGIFVEQDANVNINNGLSSFKILGHTSVKGDWLKSLDEHFSEKSRKHKNHGKNKVETWITCSISGLVREINTPEIQFEITPLNCRKVVCRTYDFLDGEPFYLRFSTPVDGYLNIFITQTDGKAYRILPYQKMPEMYRDAVPVSADTAYFFFDADDHHDYFEGFSWMMTDEIPMATNEDKEYIDLYLVFSTIPFHKPLLKNSNDTKDDSGIPAFLPTGEFMDWLQNNRLYNPDFIYKRLTLTVQK